MSELRPFGFRVLVVDPPDLEAGGPRLILPNGMRDELERGMVARGPREDEAGPDNYTAPWKPPAPGSVVHYLKTNHCFSIGDYTVVPYEAIVAVEEDASGAGL